MLIVAMLALVTFQNVPDPRLNEGVDEASRIFGECIVSEAERLEPSGEPAAAVADSAVTSCARLRDDAITIVALAARVNHRMDTPGAVSVAREVVQRWETEYRRQAQLAVIEARAVRPH